MYRGRETRLGGGVPRPCGVSPPQAADPRADLLPRAQAAQVTRTDDTAKFFPLAPPVIVSAKSFTPTTILFPRCAFYFFTLKTGNLGNGYSQAVCFVERNSELDLPTFIDRKEQDNVLKSVVGFEASNSKINENQATCKIRLF